MGISPTKEMSSSPFQAGASSPPDSPGLRAVTAQGGDVGDREGLKNHYQTEWHLHNLKRKVAGLPLLTQVQFARRQAQDQVNKDKAQPVGKEAKKLARLEKRKALKEERAEQHALKIGSKIDKETRRNQKKAIKAALASKHALPGADGAAPEEPEDEMDWSDELSESEEDEEGDEEEEPVKIIEGESLFDSEIFEDWETCLEYMEAMFGFVIPEIERVVDMEGMCQYLQLKINHCFRCLYSTKQFGSREAVKHFMESKGNRRFNSETHELEFGRFYDKMRIFGDEDHHNITHEQLQESIEQGKTPSGKTMIPRELSAYYKQKIKPDESRTAVLAVQAETLERAVRVLGEGATGSTLIAAGPNLFRKGQTAHSEMTMKSVNKIARYALKRQMNANSLFQLSDAALTHGR